MPIFVQHEDSDITTYQELNDKMLEYTEREDFAEYCLTDEYAVFTERRKSFLTYFNDKYVHSKLYHVEVANGPQLLLRNIKKFLFGYKDNSKELLQLDKLHKIRDNLTRHLEEKKRRKAQR